VAPSDGEKKKVTSANEPAAAVPAGSLSTDSIQEIWQQVVSEAGFAAQSELRKANIAAISGPNALVLSVSRRYNGSGSLFQDPARLAKVEEILSRVVGQPCTIRVQWTDVEPEATSGGKTATAAAQGQQRQLRAELLQIPLVKKVTDVLSAQIIKADDGFGAAAKTCRRT